MKKKRRIKIFTKLINKYYVKEDDPDWQKYWTHQQEKSEARLAAMFHEMKWLSENNSEFASKLTDAQKAGINSVRSDFINKKAFIGNVRKV